MVQWRLISLATKSYLQEGTVREVQHTNKERRENIRRRCGCGQHSIVEGWSNASAGTYCVVRVFKIPVRTWANSSRTVAKPATNLRQFSEKSRRTWLIFPIGTHAEQIARILAKILEFCDRI